MKIKLPGIVLFFLSLTGCIKETLDKCPEGNVYINIYAEKFQTNTSDCNQDIEEQIGKRIRFMHCILYKEDTCVIDTVIESLSEVQDSHYRIQFDGLPFGDYNLLIIGNCIPETMVGDYHRRGVMSLVYLGIEQADDMFAALLAFTVDRNETIQLETKLRRLLGVVRCEINGIPDKISEIEIVLHNINRQLGKGGIFSNAIDISKRVPVNRTHSSLPLSILMGVFPTVPNKPAVYELKFYTQGQEEAVYNKVISDKIDIPRNQMIELITDLSDGEIHFTIRLDSKWKDYINGGEIGIH